MYNIVKIYDNDAEYISHNELSPTFYKKIITWCNNSIENFNNNRVGLLTNTGAYMFSIYNSKTDAINNINLITYPLYWYYNIYDNFGEVVDNKEAFSYNNINQYSFNVVNYVNYSASSDKIFSSINIPYIGINYGGLSSSSSIFTYVKNTLAIIDTKSFTKENYLEILPFENIKISWTLDFSDKGTNSSFIPVSNINGIQSKIHDDFRYIIRSILCPQSITGSFALTGDLAITKSLSSTTANASYIDTTKMLNIGNILLYESTVGAYKNTGNQISSTSYSIIEFTKTKLDDYKISVKGIFKNNSSDILLGSILLSGYALDSNNKAHCPISWVTSKDLWGVEQRTWHTNEVIELNWILDLTPSNQTIKPIVADINNNLSTL